MRHKHILWDFDGTLAHREGMWSGTLLEILKAEQPDRAVTREEIRAHFKKGFPWHTPEIPHPDIRDADTWWRKLLPLFERTFAAVGVDTATATELAPQVRAWYCNVEKWQLFDDTVPALTALAERGWSHTILSNHVPELPDIVDALGVSDFFAAIHTSAVTGYEKPHANAYRIALEALPHGSGVWMVGDNPVADVRGAEQVGLPAVLVRKTDPKVRHQCAGLMGLLEIVESVL